MREMDFSDLRVWKKTKDIIVLVYALTKHFPKEEMYGLTNQLRRSASSICANIAEGYSRYHARDKIKFYYNARGSISESKSHVFVARDLGYLGSGEADKLLNEFDDVRKMLNGMIRSIYRCQKERKS